MIDSDKHSSLQQHGIKLRSAKFYDKDPGVKVMKLFFFVPKAPKISWSVLEPSKPFQGILSINYETMLS